MSNLGRMRVSGITPIKYFRTA